MAAVALGAWGLGRTFVGGRIVHLHPASEVALQAGFGLLAVSLVVQAQVLAGVSRTSLAAVSALMAVIGVVEAIRWWRQQAGLRFPRHPASRLGLGLAGLWSAWVFVTALLPPVGIDELVYHLDVPRRILEAGRFLRFTDNVYAYFPQGGDMLLLLGFGVGGETAAKLFHGLAGLLTGLAVFGAARALAGRWASLLAASAVMAVPTVVVIASWAYVDLYFTLYAFLALVCTRELCRAWERGADEELWTWGVFAGGMAGAAWAVKYTGLQLTLLLVLVVLVEGLRGRRRGVPRQLLALPTVALLLVAPWLLRNWFLTGWPLFPFDIGPFSLAPGLNWGPERADLYLAWLSQFGGGVERSLVGKLTAPITVFLTARFGDLTAFDGMVGPVFLVAPLAFLERRERPVRTLGTFAGAFLLYWAFTTTQVRFLLPALPALAVLLAVAVEGRFSRWLAPVCVALVLAAAGLGAREVARQDPWAFWSGHQDRREWLRERVVGVGLYEEANRRLQAGDRLYLLNMRTFGYLLDLPETDASLARAMISGEPEPFPGGFRADYVFQQYRLGERLREATGSADLDRFFADMGITHLMIDEGVTLSRSALAPRQRERLVDWLRTRGEEVARDPDDPRQKLYRLRLSPAGSEAPPP